MHTHRSGMKVSIALETAGWLLKVAAPQCYDVISKQGQLRSDPLRPTVHTHSDTLILYNGGQ